MRLHRKQQAAGRLRLSLAVSLLQGGLATINLLQWNPHWECFERNERNCKQEFSKTLLAELAEGDIDFANIVEFNDKERTLPARWGTLDHKCGLDHTTLIYNTERWALPPAHTAGRRGCMAHEDRPFIVQQFTEAKAWGGSRKVTVVGAHYPHTKDRASLRRAVQAVIVATGATSLLLLADTNEDRGVRSEHLMWDIDAPNGTVLSSALHSTCCWSNGFMPMMAYDRIMANFGSSISTTVLLSEMPDWAQGEFHKPIRVKLLESTTKTSTTTTISTSTISTTSSSTRTSKTTTSTGTTVTSTLTTLTTTTTTTTAPALALIWVGIGTTSSCSVASLILLCGMFSRKLLQQLGQKPLGAAMVLSRVDASEASRRSRETVDEVASYRLEPDEYMETDDRPDSDDNLYSADDTPCEALMPDGEHRVEPSGRKPSWRRLLKPVSKRPAEKP